MHVRIIGRPIMCGHIPINRLEKRMTTMMVKDTKYSEDRKEVCSIMRNMTSAVLPTSACEHSDKDKRRRANKGINKSAVACINHSKPKHNSIQKPTKHNNATNSVTTQTRNSGTTTGRSY